MKNLIVALGILTIFSCTKDNPVRTSLEGTWKGVGFSFSDTLPPIKPGNDYFSFDLTNNKFYFYDDVSFGDPKYLPLDLNNSYENGSILVSPSEINFIAEDKEGRPIPFDDLSSYQNATWFFSFDTNDTLNVIEKPLNTEKILPNGDILKILYRKRKFYRVQ